MDARCADLGLCRTLLCRNGVKPRRDEFDQLAAQPVGWAVMHMNPRTLGLMIIVRSCSGGWRQGRHYKPQAWCLAETALMLHAALDTRTV